MALVSVVMYGLEMFSDVGIRPSIIQNRRGAETAFLNTALAIQIVRGVALWLLTCALAWPAAWFFARANADAWQLLHLLPVCGLSALIAGFNSPALALFNRRLNFGWITMVDVGSHLTTVVVMIGWALVSPTVWALVVGGLSASIVRLILSHALPTGHRVRLQWDSSCARELLRFGKWVFASTAFTFLAQHLDRIILGKLLTLGELGVYGIALVFARVADSVAGHLSSTVMFPVLSRYQDDSSRLVSVCLRAREVVLTVGGTVCVAIAMIAPLFFGMLYDERYHAAGMIAQWLSIYIWATIIVTSMDRIPLALGNSRALFVANVLKALGMGLAAGGYAVAGLTGFIVGMAGAQVLAFGYLLTVLPTGWKPMLIQSMWYSVAFGAYAAGALGAAAWVKPILSTGWHAAATVALAALPCTVGAARSISLIREPGRPAVAVAEAA